MTPAKIGDYQASKWWYGGIAIAVLAYLAQVFSQLPFLQHELIGQAFWWTQPNETFLGLIFDSERMDCFAGRFRYIEYLIQAGYWKAMAAGYLPRDLYDLVAIVATLGSLGLLCAICRRKGLSPFETFLIGSFFLLSTHVFMIAVFNFRKAKFLAAFLFLLMLYLSLLNLSRKKLLASFVAIGIIGFITDPYFILLSPLVALGADVSKGERAYPHLRSTIVGLILGAGLVLLLNNVIGPNFSPHSRIPFTEIKGKPAVFLNLSNIPHFLSVIPELITPQTFDVGVIPISLLTFGFFSALLFYMMRSGWRECGWILLFLTSLPLAAFFILPVRANGYFSGYYGQPFFLFLVLAIIEVIWFLKKTGKTKALQVSYLVVIAIGLSHHFSKTSTFQHWQNVYSTSASAKEKAFKDYRYVMDINHHLARESKLPYVLPLDSWKLKSLYLAKGQYFDDDGKLEHSDVAYLLIPAIFKKEFDEGKIRIQLNRTALPTAKKGG